MLGHNKIKKIIDDLDRNWSNVHGNMFSGVNGGKHAAVLIALECVADTGFSK